MLYYLYINLKKISEIVINHSSFKDFNIKEKFIKLGYKKRTRPKLNLYFIYLKIKSIKNLYLEYN